MYHLCRDCGTVGPVFPCEGCGKGGISAWLSSRARSTGARTRYDSAKPRRRIFIRDERPNP